MHLLNDTSEIYNTSLIQNREEWGESKIEGERERERMDKECEAECS